MFPTAEVLESDAVNMWIFPKMKAPKMGGFKFQVANPIKVDLGVFLFQKISMQTN